MAAPTKRVDDDDNLNEFVRSGDAKEVWKPRLTPEEYAERLKDCQSFGNLFHHYYIYGVRPTCKAEEQDFMNAVRWKTNKNEESKNALQEQESKLKRNHHVWDMRQERIPPKEWTMPILTENSDS